MTDKKQTAQDILDTIGYDEFVRALFNRSGDPSKDFAHCILGIVTECHEYITATDDVNAIEEAGDLYFYGVALGRVITDYLGEGCPEDVIDQEVADRTEAELDLINSRQFLPEVARRCASLLDEAKRWVGYGSLPKTPLPTVYAEAIVLVAFVLGHGMAADAHPDDVARVNVEKLLERYQGLTFSADRAMNRDTGKEREALESAVGAAA